MVEDKMIQPSEPAPAVLENDFIKRELNGASFLSLEHTAHMLLAVVVPLLIASAIAKVMELWWGVARVPDADLLMPIMADGQPLMAICMVAALIVLVPALWLFDRRTRAEWVKRRGFSSRLSYKLPIYGAIAILTTVAVCIKISLLATIIASLAMIGVPDADIAGMYANQFLPALLSQIIVVWALWYVVMLAKGRDFGKSFSTIMAIIAAALAVSLLATAVTALHSKPDTRLDPYDNYMKDYNRNMDDYLR